MPERTCIGCRRRAASQELVRFVGVGETVAVDRSGRAQGRGAWLCRSAGCFEIAITRRAFQRALRRPLSVDVATLRSDFEKLIGEKTSGQRPGV